MFHKKRQKFSDYCEEALFFKSKQGVAQANKNDILYRIYVIELSKRVFTENRKFREANPQFNGVLQCLYIGMTSKSPKERFEQHKKSARSKKGHKISSNVVEKYGLYLRPSLYNQIEPIKTRAEALKAEESLALKLRRERYAVWFN